LKPKQPLCDLIRDIVKCKILKYNFENENHCVYSVDCSVRNEGNLLWVSESPEKFLGYSKNDLEDIEINNLLPKSIVSQHKVFFSAYKNSGISQKMFKRTIVSLIRKDQTCQMAEMWIKPYIQLFPLKPILLTLNKKLITKNICHIVTDGTGDIESFSEIFIETLNLEKSSIDCKRSIFCFAPELILFYLEISKNSKYLENSKELSSNISWTKVMSSSGEAEYNLKVDWNPFFTEDDSDNIHRLSKEVFQANDLELGYIISEFKKLKKTSSKLLNIKLEANVVKLPNSELLVYLGVKSISEKKKKNSPIITAQVNSNNKLVEKMDSIKEQITIKLSVNDGSQQNKYSTFADQVVREDREKVVHLKPVSYNIYPNDSVKYAENSNSFNKINFLRNVLKGKSPSNNLEKYAGSQYNIGSNTNTIVSKSQLERSLKADSIQVELEDRASSRFTSAFDSGGKIKVLHDKLFSSQVKMMAVMVVFVLAFLVTAFSGFISVS
jgi:hypothetical protein